MRLMLHPWKSCLANLWKANKCKRSFSQSARIGEKPVDMSESEFKGLLEFFPSDFDEV